MSALLCRNIKCMRELHCWTHVTRLLVQRANATEERAEDLIGVWGMYMFGNGLVSCMCECVSLSVCHCLPVWLSVCLWVSVFANVHMDVWVGVSSALWQCWLLLIQLGRDSCKGLPPQIYCKTPSFTNILCGRTGHWCEIFINFNNIVLNHRMRTTFQFPRGYSTQVTHPKTHETKR